MAPILSFTAEEAWRVLYPADPTILAHTWQDALPAVPDAPALIAKWERILAVRAVVQKELETVRQSGAIGSSLQAEVSITAPEPAHAALASLGDDLRFVTITSAASLAPGAELAVRVAPSRAREVRPLLALARRRRRRCRGIRRCAAAASPTCSARARRAGTCRERGTAGARWPAQTDPGDHAGHLRVGQVSPAGGAGCCSRRS